MFLILFKYKQCFLCKEKQLPKRHLHANIWVNLNVINGEKQQQQRHTFINKEWKKERDLLKYFQNTYSFFFCRELFRLGLSLSESLLP